MTPTCTVCARTKSPRWMGAREGKLKCLSCYRKERHAKVAVKAKLKVFDMWER